MNTSVKIAAVLALVVAGQALAASTVTYDIWLGGNNNDTTWENGPSPRAVDYVLKASGNADAQTYTTERINWAVVVNVSGAQAAGKGAGFVPAGIANMVFDLELQSSAGTTITTLVAASPANSPTVAGWYSTINDGDTDGGVKNDPRKNAAYAISYNIDAMRPADSGGRVVDAYAAGGPFMDQYTFPSADGWWEGAGHTGQVTGTACGGLLKGMGAGYSGAQGTGGWLLAYYSSGVGLTASNGTCLVLGNRAIFEGQLSMKNMAAGTYKLMLTPKGTNVLANVGDGAICDDGTAGGFADPPDNTPLTDTIVFYYNNVIPLAIQAAQSRKNHGTNTFGTSAGSTEGRTGRVTTVWTDFNQNIQCNGGTCDVTDFTLTSGTFVSATIAADILTVTLTANTVTDKADFRIGYPGIQALGQPTNTTAVTKCWKVMDGDTNNTSNVNAFDLTAVRGVLGQVASASNYTKDVNVTGGINAFDLTYVRGRLGKTYTSTCVP